MIRVLIVDDHALIRQGLCKVFDGASDITVVAQAADAAQALTRVRENELDVVVMDIHLPDISGLDAMRKILLIRPGLPVLFLSMLPETGIAVQIFKAGAAGFVSKESAVDDIVEAVRHVVAGRKYVSPMLAEQLALRIGQPDDRPAHETLSAREFQVLRLIASGLATRQVAEKMALSINTIATYRRRIFEKTGLRSDVELARYAMEHQLPD